jgi:hypothetical protein
VPATETHEIPLEMHTCKLKFHYSGDSLVLLHYDRSPAADAAAAEDYEEYRCKFIYSFFHIQHVHVAARWSKHVRTHTTGVLLVCILF